MARAGGLTVAFARPTLDELRARTRAEFRTRFPEADSLLPTSNLRITADVLAGMMHLQYGYLDWIAAQSIPDTAETDGLERWAAIFGLSRKPGTAAVGNVTFTGANGTAVPAGTQLRRADGQLYGVDVGGTVSAGTLTVAVTSISAAAAAAADAGVTLSLVTAISGLSGTATVAAGGLGSAADPEDDTALRSRLLDRIRQAPQGGAANDYRAWALAQPGVTRVWVVGQAPAVGQVTVYFAMDGIRTDGLPLLADVDAVQAAIDQLRPVTAEVFVEAPTVQTIAVTITGLSPDTPAVRAAIAAELADVMLREGSPGGTIRLSWLWEAVSQASGERSHRITTPSADVVLSAGALPKLGTITYA
jgi:uncharacterized phage protein gp47/JayE